MLQTTAGENRETSQSDAGQKRVMENEGTQLLVHCHVKPKKGSLSRNLRQMHDDIFGNGCMSVRLGACFKMVDHG